MKKINRTNNSEIVENVEDPTPKPRFFGRRKTFVDPQFKFKFNRFDTYEENKMDYYDTLQLVFSGKCKNIFEALKFKNIEFA